MRRLLIIEKTQKMSALEEIQIKNIDHLGIVAGLIDEIGIVEVINEKLGIDKREKISSGQVLKAMILNGLGMVSRPLYLFSQFFEDKAVQKLLGDEIKSEYLNDDKIGRVMDEMYKMGLNGLFIEIVLSVIKKFQIETKYSHLDSTSFHLDGEYKNEIVKEENEEIIKERPILITKGYSRDHRPDLKQCVLDLIVSNDGDIPLFMRTGDGNESDKAVFGKILVEFKRRINLDSIMVADSALYSQENLKIMEDLNWITRVPLTVKKAKELIQSVSVESIEDLENIDPEERELIAKLQEKGYKWKEMIVDYGGVKQRWLIVESESRKESDWQRLEEKIKKEELKAEKLLRKLEKEEFENLAQGRYKLNQINKLLKLALIKEVEIIEIVSKANKKIYNFKGKIELDNEEIGKKRQEAGKFILATNILDEQKIKSQEILKEYKNQQGSERGFGFLKDPLFFADSFFVEKPERVETILFLMSLCLLVYNLGQRELRNSLKRAQTGVKNQIGKLTDHPTLRWIFQCFQGIHLLTLNGIQQVINLKKERSFILELLPSSCQKYYL
jgi:transposase